jgi:hypothetical protein
VLEAMRLEVALWSSCGPRPERRGWHAARVMTLDDVARGLAQRLISPGC